MVITRTPLRISFFGGGTDYPIWYREHGGVVLSTSIDKYCYITTRYIPPFFDCNYRIRYRYHEEVKTIAEIRHPSVRECLAFTGLSQGIEMQHNADVPGMSGLGTSSAFTVGFLHSLYALADKEVTKYQLALDAIHVEQNRIGENVGSQDQVATAFGGFNKIEFGGEKEIVVTSMPISSVRSQEFQKHLLLIFTGYPRDASEVASEQIQKTPLRFSELMNMQKLVGEAHRILVSETRSLEDLGELLHETWMLKRSLTSKISTTHIDEVYNTGRSAGAMGGKLLGAGGGGFMLFFARPENHTKILQSLKGLLRVPFRFETLGSHVIYQMPTELSSHTYTS